MNSFVVNALYKVEDLIGFIRNGEGRDDIYMVYEPAATDDWHLGMEVYVGEMPTYDDDDNATLPDAVTKMGFERGYMQEHLEDVVDLAYRQKPNASIDEVIRCLNHYADYDDFLDLAP